MEKEFENESNNIDKMLSRDYSNSLISDIHIKANLRCFFRVNGFIKEYKRKILNKQDIREFIKANLNNKQYNTLEKQGSIDISVIFGENRYRLNIYSSNDGYNLAFRILRSNLIKLSDIGVTDAVFDEISKKSGLILITGKTGSGKSTTLNSIINEINNTEKKHIITIEHPIEFFYTSKESIITQIEVNKDVPTFSRAVVSSLRQDPDIIVIGEMRDRDTMKAALTASETGHLVLSTLHTNSAAESVDRIVESFNSDEHNHILYLLSRNLNMVISQELLYINEINRRVAVFEIMIANDAIRNMIRQKKTYLIKNEILSGKSKGMVLKKDSKDRVLKHYTSKERESPVIDL